MAERILNEFELVRVSYTTTAKNVETLSRKKKPFILQIAARHRSVRYNTDLPPPYHSKLFLQVLNMVFIASNFDKGWSGGHKHKIMDRLFK